MAGIAACGAYLPRLRLQRKAIFEANAWFSPGLRGAARGERSMANQASAVTNPNPATPGAAPAPAAAPAAAVATQTSNWPGVVADVTEFRRKGSTLSVRVVLRNQGNVDSEPDVNYNEVYVMDLGAGKKYEVLKDEKGTYIAALRTGYNNRWYQKLAPGASYTIWMKFPAPPPEVKSVTLQLPGMPPFEDVPIQDS